MPKSHMSTQTPLLQTIEPDDVSTNNNPQRKPDAPSQHAQRQSPATNSMASNPNDAESGIVSSQFDPGMQLTRTNQPLLVF